MNSRSKVGSAVLGIFLACLCIVSKQVTLSQTPQPFFLIWLILALYLFARFLGDEVQSTRGPVFWAILAYVLVLYFTAALHGNSPFIFQRVGFWTWLLILYALSRSWCMKSKKNAVLIAQMIYVVWMFGTMTYSVLKGSDYIYPENSIIISFHLVAFTLLNYDYFKKGMRRNIFILGSVVLILLVKSEAALLSLGASLLVLVPLQVLLPILLLGFAGMLYWKLQSHQVGSRMLIWQAAIEKIRESPLFGHGLESYVIYHKRPMAHPHSPFLLSFMQSGIAGAVAYFSYLLALFTEYRSLTVPARQLLIAFTVWSFFDDPLFWAGSGTLFVLALSFKDDQAVVGEG